MKPSEVKELLIDNGANVSHRDANGIEPLYHALERRDNEIVNLLIEKEVRLTSRYEGRSYLMLAVLLKDEQLVKTFLDTDVSLTVKDFKGQTALDLAVKSGLKNILLLFKEKIGA